MTHLTDLLAGVPRYTFLSDDGHLEHFVLEADVLAALSAAPVDVTKPRAALSAAPVGVDAEEVARAVYDAMRFERKDKTPEWVKGGNSNAQVEARATAHRIMAALTPAPADAPAEDAAAKGETPGQMLDRLGMDGVKWAAEFRTTALRLGYSDMDEGWLIGWFANAIMAGYDRAPPAPADEVRRKALMEAAEACRYDDAHDCRAAILALIEKDTK